MIAFALAAAILVVAAAEPQRSVAVPVTDGAVMLANDVSSSMAATDVAPSRLGAAQRAAERFIAAVPSSIRVGLLEFNQKPYLLQTPTTDHTLARGALPQLRAGGHTAIGDAIDASVRVLTGLRTPAHKRPPGAIVLLSDGTSTNGANPIAAARYAAAQHIPVYTVALGTQHGTITVRHGRRNVSVPVPLSSQELAQVAQASGGREFTVGDAGGLSAVYRHLAVVLGHRQVNRQISAGFAGGGLVLLLLGSALSLRWFGRLV
jgi:Ca-activated chloride channel family protein